jgi:hypothetical protein
VPAAEPVTDQPQSVDQPQVQDNVQGKTRRGHHQGRPGVLQAAKKSGAGEDQQHGHQAGHGPAEIVDGESAHLAFRSEQADQRAGRQEPGHGQDRPQQQCQPDAVAPGRQGFARLPVTHRTRHCRSGGVSQEDHQADGGVQHRRCQADAGQLCHAEVANNRRIREQEERFGDEGAKGGNCQPKDLAGMSFRRGGRRRGR